jgi:glyoxylase-like metal-dependent hydrolase (beta-lactamase superfamily II)
MSKALRTLLVLLVITLVGGAAAVLLSPGLQKKIFDRAAMELTAPPNAAPLADDALRVAICGSSAPLPSTARAKACVAVFAGGKFYVVDAGPESVENIVLWNVPMPAIGGVMLTHFHSDHIGELGELNLQTWAGGRKAPLDVYGGPGVDRVVEGFNEAYAQDQVYRTTHHGEQLMPSANWRMIPHTVELDGPETAAKDRTGLVLEDGDLRVTAIEVDHSPINPAYAYRFDYKGRSAVITGDLKYHPDHARHRGLPHRARGSGADRERRTCEAPRLLSPRPLPGRRAPPPAVRGRSEQGPEGWLDDLGRRQSLHATHRHEGRSGRQDVGLTGIPLAGMSDRATLVVETFA